MPHRKLKDLEPLWMKDKQTGMVAGFFFICPTCPPILLGLMPHPILLYTDKEFANAQRRECWTMHGKSFNELSILGLIHLPGCSFAGWIRKGLVSW